MWHWLSDAYRSRISETGREPLFLLLVGLIGSFLLIRFSVRMIRRGVKWWPGNVQPGGLHIHHVVFGQAMMLVGGIGSFAVRGGPVAHDVLAVVFGVGCGLVLDEFALVLHLEDVYWSEQGRQSVDAVILAVSLIGLLLIGEAPLGGYVGGTSVGHYVAAAVVVGFVVLCLAKGKVWTGLIGVMVPPIALVGAVRLARPASPWARWRYTARPRRMARAERREDRVHRRVVGWKTAVMDAVAGAPTPVLSKGRAAAAAGEPTATGAGTGGGAARATIVELPPSRLETVLQRVLRPAVAPGAAVAVWYLRIATAVNVVTGAIAPFRDRVRAATDGEYVTAFLVSPGFTGAVLAFVLSVSLRRRKRAAWIVTVCLTGGYTILTGVWLGLESGTRGHLFNWVSLALTLAMLVALLVSRPLFNVRGERGNLALGLLSLVIGSAVAVGVGTLLVHASDQAPPRQWGASLRYALLRVLTVSGLFDLPGVQVPGWTDITINVLSVALILVVLLAFFRAPRGRARLHRADERRLRALLRAYGRRDSLGYFALRRDKSVSWTPDRDAAVLYRVVNGVALASGDPIGSPAAWPRAVTDWRTTAHRHAWVPAITNAGPAATAVYEAAGFHALASGDEAVVDVAGFATAFRAAEGSPADGEFDGEFDGQSVGRERGGARVPAAMAGGDGSGVRVRGGGRTEAGSAGSRAGGAAVAGSGADGGVPPGGVSDAAVEGLVRGHRVVAGAGYTAVFRRYRELDAEEWGRLAQLADAWRRHSAERGFSVALGRLGDRADGDCLLAECRDPRGRTCAVLSFVPWGPDGLTLDLLRRDRESGRAPVDFLTTELLLRAAAGVAPLAGVTRVSLNFTAFRSALTTAPGRRTPLRLLARGWHIADREREYAAYHPSRHPRYLLYERRTELPRVATAYAIAEGFLTAPRLRRRTRLLTQEQTAGVQPDRT